MVEDNETTGQAYKGEGIRAALWAAFGVGTAAAAKYVMGGNGGIFGGAQPPPASLATQRDLEYERKLTEANAEIGQLKAEKYADAGALAVERRLTDKIEALEKSTTAAQNMQAVFNAKQQGFIDVLAGQVAAFDRMTARYIVQPVMATSEAALGIKPAAAAANAASDS